MKLSRFRAVPAVFFLVVWSGSPALCQSSSGRILGSVRDASGSNVAGAAITVTNERSGETYTRTSNSLGEYEFDALIPGTYTVHGQAAGFRAVDIKGIVLQVDQTAHFDLNLEVGQTSESITVTAAAPVLAQDTSDIGQVINRRQIVDLPLNGRNYIQLASLTNGVLLQGGTESGGPQFTSDGNRIQQNSFLIDGVESRIQREGGYGINLSIDAIQEFKVMQNSYEAEYGRATAIVNTVLKSGTNELHGTLFEFLRNDALDARNFFDLTNVKPPLRQNQFGGSVGGPIRKDKLFYFVDYEGQRIRQASTAQATVPTAAQLSGNLSGLTTAIDPITKQPFPNNQIPSDRISQFAKATAAYYPAPNSTALTGVNYLQVLSNPTNMDQGTARIDYLLSPNNRLSGHFIDYQYEHVGQGAIEFTGIQGYSHARQVQAEYIHTFGPTVLNTLRFGYGNTVTYFGPDHLLSGSVTGAFGLQNLAPEPPAYAPPNVLITGYSSIGGAAFYPEGSTDLTTQIVDQVSWVKGRHSLKFGTDLRFYRWNDLGYATQNGQYQFNGQYTGNSLADLLLGLPSYGYVDQKGSNYSYSYNTTNNEYSFYAQDDIRVTPSLTVNAGLRYEYVQWPKEDHNQFASWDFQKGTLAFACKDIPCRVAPPDKNGWSPRLGLAWTPAKKTVIRASASIMYGNFRQWEVSLFHFTPPYIYEYFRQNQLGTPLFTTATLWPAVPQSLSQVDFTTTTVNYQNPDKVLPKYYQWNFGVQHELVPNLLAEVRYVGNRGVHLPIRYDANAAVEDVNLLNPTPIQSRRPYQNVGFVSGNASAGWSTYNALEARVEKRFASGASILGTYTWSKTLGLRYGDNYTVFDFNNIRLNYGPYNDYTHRAVISFVYELPFGAGKPLANHTPRVVNFLIAGWQVNGIASFNSGAALGTASSVSNNRGNRAGNYANCLGDPHLSHPTIAEWFNVNAFADPLPGAYGNCGEGILRGPGAQNWDLSLFKNVKILERTTLQFRWEAFNAFNHTNFGNPDTNVSDKAYGYFGRIYSANAGRIMQGSLKLIF